MFSTSCLTGSVSFLARSNSICMNLCSYYKSARQEHPARPVRRWKTTFDQHCAGLVREVRGVRRVVARLRGHRKVFRVVGESGAVGRLQRPPDPTQGAQQACWSGFSELFQSDPSADWSQGAIKSGPLSGSSVTPFLDTTVALALVPARVEAAAPPQTARPHRLHPLRQRPGGAGESVERRCRGCAAAGG